MILRNFLSSLLIFFLAATNSLYTQPIEYLQKEDISSIMQEIFEQHVQRKEMTEEILKNSLRIYIEQFDPEKMYFLESEVRPFTQPGNLETSAYMTAYNNERYTPYQQIDLLIKKGIERARRLRAQMANGNQLFNPYPISVEEANNYATSKGELRDRIRNDMRRFIQMQKERYGPDVVQRKQEAVLRLYEKEREDWENPYLYLNDNNQPLTSKEKEHQFSMHVLKALANSLDSHTSFLDPTEAYDMRMRLLKGYVGTGILLEEGLDGYVITGVVPDSPASKSGKIQKGDILTAVNGEDVTNDSYQHLLNLLEGDEGTSVRFTLRRRSGGSYYQTVQVTLPREQIFMAQDRVETSYESFANGIIGKITLHSFYQNKNGISSEKDVRNAIEQLKQKGPLLGLVLDLRDNSGGYLSQAVRVAGLFVTNGVIVVSKYSDGEKRYFRDIDGKTWFDGPLVILTSKMTASAAEIVAQALQDYGVAVIVGDDRTYGKGSIQNQTVTQKGTSSFFKVTVGKYYTVSGKTPQIKGVVADIVVPSRYEFDDVGERYLSQHLDTDTIEPTFKDKLADVEPDVRQWFIRYYTPTLQPKLTTWQKILPELRNKSGQRIASNHALSPNDQMEEAVNIIKDMIMLKDQVHKSQLGLFD